MDDVTRLQVLGQRAEDLQDLLLLAASVEGAPVEGIRALLLATLRDLDEVAQALAGGR